MRIWLAGILVFIHLSNTCDYDNWESCPLIRYKLYHKYFYDIDQNDERLIVDDVPTVYQHRELSVEDFEKYALTIAMPLDADPLEFTLETDTYDKPSCKNDFFDSAIGLIGNAMHNMFCLCYEDMLESEEERFESLKHMPGLDGVTYFCGRNYSMICMRTDLTNWNFYITNPGVGISWRGIWGEYNDTVPYVFNAKKLKDRQGGHIFHPFGFREYADNPKYALLNMTVNYNSLNLNYNATAMAPAPKKRIVKDEITGETYTTIRVMPMRYRVNDKSELYRFYKSCLIKWHFPQGKLYHHYQKPPPPSNISATVSAERFRAAESFRPSKRAVTPKPVHRSTTIVTTTSTASGILPIFAILLPLGMRSTLSWLIYPLFLVQPVICTDEVTNYNQYALKKSAYKYDYTYEGSFFTIRQKYTGFSLNTVTKHEFEKYSARLILPENGTISLRISHESHNAMNGTCTAFLYVPHTTGVSAPYQSCLCYEDNFNRESERFSPNVTREKNAVYFCGHGFSMICLREEHILFNAGISRDMAEEIISKFNQTTPAIFRRANRTDEDLFEVKLHQHNAKNPKLVKIKFPTVQPRTVTNNPQLPIDGLETEVEIPAPKIRPMVDPATGAVVNTIRVMPVQYQYERFMKCREAPGKCDNYNCYVTWRFANARWLHDKPPWWTKSVNGIGTTNPKLFVAGEPMARNATFPVKKEEEDEESGASGMAAASAITIAMFLCVYLLFD